MKNGYWPKPKKKKHEDVQFYWDNFPWDESVMK